MAKYIEFKNAEIRWNEKNNLITEFKVYEATNEDLKKYSNLRGTEREYESHISRKEKNYHLSHGRCTSSWTDGSVDFRLSEAMRHIINSGEKLKTVLHELGKINEFESIRRLYWNKFTEILPNHDFEQFKNAVYPDDFDYKWN